MKPEDENKAEWVVMNAKRFNQDNPDEPVPGRLQYDPRKKQQTIEPPLMPGGFPVDADVAVRFISNFINNYESKNADNFDKETNPKILQDALKGLNLFIKQVLDVTYGISFDKDIILKILSQPGCTGIRMYLCDRARDEKNHVSLVVVGVNDEQFDLNYDNVGLTDANLPNYSIIAEYGYPPGKTVSVKEKSIDPHYYLLTKAVKNDSQV